MPVRSRTAAPGSCWRRRRVRRASCCRNCSTRTPPSRTRSGGGAAVRHRRAGAAAARRADVALLHLPFDSTTGLDTEELVTEQQVAVLPAGHPLARRPHLRMAEVETLSGLPMPRWPRADGSYPDGPGPEVRDHAQLLQLIALGRTVVVLPESVRSLLLADLAVVPVPDAPAVTTVIAWPPHGRSRPSPP
ncbi:LysR substrate-binding domain-containing protein [Micromonospora sp. BRA006-A]|nr:LysR substrate-binding domain-containing protein [Micromonospora sp. BRA006-A]